MGARVKLYTDEHVPKAVEKGLRERGVDVVTTHEAGMLGADDREQLAFARKESRVLFTQDEDFLKIHASGFAHAGIVYVRQETKIGRIVRGLMLVYDVMDAGDMVNRIEFL